MLWVFRLLYTQPPCACESGLTCAVVVNASATSLCKPSSLVSHPKSTTASPSPCTTLLLVPGLPTPPPLALCTPGELRPLLLLPPPCAGLLPLLLLPLPLLPPPPPPPPPPDLIRCASALTPMISCLLRAFSRVYTCGHGRFEIWRESVRRRQVAGSRQAAVFETCSAQSPVLL